MQYPVGTAVHRFLGPLECSVASQVGHVSVEDLIEALMGVVHSQLG